MITYRGKVKVVSSRLSKSHGKCLCRRRQKNFVHVAIVKLHRWRFSLSLSLSLSPGREEEGRLVVGSQEEVVGAFLLSSFAREDLVKGEEGGTTTKKVRLDEGASFHSWRKVTRRMRGMTYLILGGGGGCVAEAPIACNKSNPQLESLIGIIFLKIKSPLLRSTYYYLRIPWTPCCSCSRRRGLTARARPAPTPRCSSSRCWRWWPCT